MAHEVFLSHASEDRAFAEALVSALESSGVRCWVAPRDILPGQDYAEALVDALDCCRVLILLLSARSNESPHVRREAERAASRGIPIVPVRIQNVPLSKSLQYFIGSSHWTDALEPPVEKHVPRIADAVRRHLAVPSVTPSPAGEGRAPGGAPPAPTAVPRSRAVWFAGAAVLVAGGAGAWLHARRAAPGGGTLHATESGGTRAVVLEEVAGARAAADPSACSSSAAYTEAMRKGADSAERRSPFGAHEAFKKALASCPGDAAAQEGLKKAKLGLVNEYREKGDSDWKAGKFWDAQFNYDLALGYWPGSESDSEFLALKAKKDEALKRFHAKH